MKGYQPLAISHKLFNEAKKYIPGGVNSPVRSFKAVGGYPVFVKQGKGSKIYGECGREFIDYCLSWGALILGHVHPKVIEALEPAVKNGTSFGTATKLETELARLIVEAVPSIEQVRLTNSGTEAVMSAVRLARAYTGKNKIIKFEGSYHGHADYLLDCGGIPENFKRCTMVCSYNSIEEAEEIIKENSKDIAAIIVEPVAGNMGIVLPKEGFLEGLRIICDKYNIVLIFDEVITGFRLTYGSAQDYFKVRADLTCLGKIIGGGLPVGAFGGREDIMELLAPQGPVYHAGTFSGNPIGVTAGLQTLKVLKTINYKQLQQKTITLCNGIKQNAKKFGIDVVINQIGSMFTLFFTKTAVYDCKTAKSSDIKLYAKFFHGMLKLGIYFPPSQFETFFVSSAHRDEDIEKTIIASNKVFKQWSTIL